MPFIIDARNMGGGSIGSAAGGDTSTGTRNNVTLAAQWDESKEYLKGDLATNNGDLYQAQKSVPAGVQISDEDYWALVVAGDKSKETEQLRKDIGSLGDLETEAKENLVAAINEAAETKAAGGTDISLGLTSAAIGQIIKVKAVDASGNLRTANRLLDGASAITADEYTARLAYIRENAVHFVDDTPVGEEMTIEQEIATYKAALHELGVETEEVI